MVGEPSGDESNASRTAAVGICDDARPADLGRGGPTHRDTATKRDGAKCDSDLDAVGEREADREESPASLDRQHGSPRKLSPVDRTCPQAFSDGR